MTCFDGVVGPRLPEQTHSFYSELADHDSSFYSTRTMTKRCDFPVGAMATQLATAISGEDPLHAPLPGRTTSIHDALIGCL